MRYSVPKKMNGSPAATTGPPGYIEKQCQQDKYQDDAADGIFNQQVQPVIDVGIRSYHEVSCTVVGNLPGLPLLGYLNRAGVHSVRDVAIACRKHLQSDTVVLVKRDNTELLSSKVSLIRVTSPMRICFARREW